MPTTIGLFERQIADRGLLPAIANGVLLCKLAILINSEASKTSSKITEAVRRCVVGERRLGHAPVLAAALMLLLYPLLAFSHAPIVYNTTARAGDALAARNIACFLQWASVIGVPDFELFTPEDLALGRNELRILFWFALICSSSPPPSLLLPLPSSHNVVVIATWPSLPNLSLSEVIRAQRAVPPSGMIAMERSLSDMTSEEASQIMAAAERTLSAIGLNMRLQYVGDSQFMIDNLGPIVLGLLREV